MQNDIKKSLRVLLHGGILLYPTDTVWGLGCDATNAEAVKKIIALKGRMKGKSFVVLATEDMLPDYITKLDREVLAYLKTVSKPTTVIYEKVRGIAQNAVAEDGSVAIRLCKEPFCEALLKAFKKPILSTSANLSGMPTPAIFAEIDSRIVSGADYVVIYRQEDTHRTAASAIVKWKAGAVEVLRN